MTATNPEKIVNVFIPCGMDMFSPNVANSTLSLIEKLGFTPFYNENQTCCGRRFYMEGKMDYARELGDKLMSVFDPKHPIVVPSSACVGFIRKYYKKLLENTHVPMDLKLFTDNIFEISDFIVNQLGITKLNNYFNQRVFYFKSCSARNLYRYNNAPEVLLQNTAGLEFLSDSDMNMCCSANGNFALASPETANKMLEQIVTKIYSMGAQYITSTDIHCLQYIDAYIQENDIGLEVIHLVDIYNATAPTK